MNTIDKKAAYEQARQELYAILDEETDLILKMATINCVLKQHLPYYFWVGFYSVKNGALIVGPYQGTLGCLHIPFSKGVCGRAARTEQTQIVENVHDDLEHVACDSQTNSEIVVPVFGNDGKLIAVFDVDSTELAAFDKVDKAYLEEILLKQFKELKIEN